MVVSHAVIVCVNCLDMLAYLCQLYNGSMLNYVDIVFVLKHAEIIFHLPHLGTAF